jgi:hypothetical protein
MNCFAYGFKCSSAARSKLVSDSCIGLGSGARPAANSVDRALRTSLSDVMPRLVTRRLFRRRSSLASALAIIGTLRRHHS